MRPLPGSHESVEAMVRAGRGEVAADALAADALAHRLTEALAIQRTLRGVSQAAVASAMGCGQAKVSKLEAAPDATVALGEAAAFCSAIGMRLRVVLEPAEAVDDGPALVVEVRRPEASPPAPAKGRGRPVGSKAGG